ncbi:hypothetical protein JP75_06725 [Devosia riboflavina]|uniref:Uncharacterized protein n=1 Tax=Devosia riboflavina TaxID=46914 RepID=A0A087M4E6_9HYPH|nr:hypothetical protein JP75_06725 [Devosia riboflavina]
MARRAQIDAGSRIGAAAAQVTLEPQPGECAVDTQHAPLFVGQEAIVALRLERVQLDAANASKRRCYLFNQNLANGLRQGAQ